MAQAAAVKAGRPAANRTTAPKPRERAGAPVIVEHVASETVVERPTKERIAPSAAKGKRSDNFVCSHFDAESVWKSMLESNDERIRLAAAKYLTDRLYGRAAPAMKRTGEMDHKITVVVDL